MSWAFAFDSVPLTLDFTRACCVPSAICAVEALHLESDTRRSLFCRFHGHVRISSVDGMLIFLANVVDRFFIVSKQRFVILRGSMKACCSKKNDACQTPQKGGCRGQTQKESGANYVYSPSQLTSSPSPPSSRRGVGQPVLTPPNAFQTDQHSLVTLRNGWGLFEEMSRKEKNRQVGTSFRWFVKTHREFFTLKNNPKQLVCQIDTNLVYFLTKK